MNPQFLPDPPADRPNASIAGQPLVSVIVPHYNDLMGLQLCHQRLLAQTWPADRYEIVVADNNSQCGIDAVSATAPHALVVVETTPGAGPARNTGVAASRGEVIAFLDSDCVPQPDWIAQGVAGLAGYDFVGGQVVVFPRRRDHPNAVEAYEMVFNFNFKRYIEKVGFTGTGNMFVRRHVFDSVGGFRAGVAEDVDWSFRARGQGYRLGYAERAVVGHPARWEWAQLWRRWARMLAEDFELIREQRFGVALFVAKAVVMPLSIPPHVVKVAVSNRLRGTRARLGAIAVLARLRLRRAAEMLHLAIRGM
jgi:cellulose synthase/poly-beta-1,6-N-acetylglucosamine synthase-like glycosyltransferase